MFAEEKFFFLCVGMFCHRSLCDALKGSSRQRVGFPFIAWPA
jgi:hypothetical protein